MSLLSRKVRELEGKLREGIAQESNFQDLMADFDQVATTAKREIDLHRHNLRHVETADQLLDHVQKAYFAVGSLAHTLQRPDPVRLERGCLRLREAAHGIMTTSAALGRSLA